MTLFRYMLLYCMAQRETPIMQSIRGTLNRRDSGILVYRNNVGTLKDEHGNYVTFGLLPGSADLIGFERVTVTPEMVGTTIGVFLSIEVKTPIGRLQPNQKAWMNVVNMYGGKALVMRSVTEAEQYLGGKIGAVE